MRTEDRFFLVASLGKSRKITPEGFLLCEGVPFARVGTQTYSSREHPSLQADVFGQIQVERLAEDVFRPESIASFEGKPLTLNHPPEFVTPENWGHYSVGTVHNVRRGTADEADSLLADFLITDAAAIKYANDELPQVSAGYDADYSQDVPGRARQTNIIGNHVALVRRGRAGARFSIKDEEFPVKKRTLLDRILTAFKAQDVEAVKAELAEVGELEAPIQTTDAETQASVKELTERVSVMETGLAEIKQLLTKDQKTQEERDAESTAAALVQPIFTADGVKDIIARAEILAPGIQLPTSDSLQTESGASALMRQALETVSTKAEGADVVKTFLMGRELKSLATCDALLGVFNGAAELMRAQNNQRATAALRKSTKDSGKPLSVAEINARNCAFWAQQKQ